MGSMGKESPSRIFWSILSLLTWLSWTHGGLVAWFNHIDRATGRERNQEGEDRKGGGGDRERETDAQGGVAGASWNLHLVKMII